MKMKPSYEELQKELEVLKKTNQELIKAKEKAKEELIIAKEKAEESKRQFTAVFEQSPFSIQIFNNQGLTLSVNKAWEDLWQGSKKQVVNKYNLLEDTYAEETGWLVYLRKAFKGEIVNLPDLEYDPTQSGHKGRKRILRCIAFPVKRKDITEQVVLIHQDVTDIKKYERVE